VVRYLTKCYIL